MPRSTRSSPFNQSTSNHFSARHPTTENKIKREELGWEFLEHGCLQHQFVGITRQNLNGESLVRGDF
jgi:hypothetical protein